MRTSRRIILFAVVAVLSVVALPFLGDSDNHPAPANTPAAVALTVSEAVVRETEWQEVIQATGPIAAWQEAVIGAEISGQKLIEITADVGDVVRKGDILARFSRETLTAEYAELKANWIAAESNQKRALTLKGSGAMSDQAIDNYVNLAAVAKAQMDAKGLQLKYTNVIAPDDGVISTRGATLGAVGSPGVELFRLIRQNRLEWRGEMTASQSAQVAIGQAVVLTLPHGVQAAGTVRQIAPSFDPKTRMTTIFADIEPGSGARAGMYAGGEIILGRRLALSMPAKCIVMRDGRNYVFVIRDGGSGTKTILKEVQIGRIWNDKAQILSGISAGTRVVEKGAGFLNDGDLVRVSYWNGGAK